MSYMEYNWHETVFMEFSLWIIIYEWDFCLIIPYEFIIGMFVWLFHVLTCINMKYFWEIWNMPLFVILECMYSDYWT